MTVVIKILARFLALKLHSKYSFCSEYLKFKKQKSYVNPMKTKVFVCFVHFYQCIFISQYNAKYTVLLNKDSMNEQMKKGDFYY